MGWECTPDLDGGGSTPDLDGGGYPRSGWGVSQVWMVEGYPRSGWWGVPQVWMVGGYPVTPQLSLDGEGVPQVWMVGEVTQGTPPLTRSG